MDKIHAFIDSQNLNLGVMNDVIFKGRNIYDGWKLDFEKFRKYLKDKHKVAKAYVFIGKVEGKEKLYENLETCGYELVYKPTVDYGKAKRFTKGNVDAELVLYASARKFKDYDKAIVVSGDGDFYCLYEYLIENQKLDRILIPNKHRYSSLLRKFNNYFDFVSPNKKKLSK